MDERSERIERRLEPVIIVATLLVVPVLILEGVEVDQPWPTIARVGDWVIWGVFLAEIVIMLAVVPNRRRWLADHPLDVAIVILTPPFVSSTLTSIRLLRLLRLVRLLRVAELARGAFSLAGVRYAALLAVLTAFAGGQAFADVEGTSDGTGLYWAMTTMTTVGYGDVVPHTGAGRVIAVAVMLVGIGFVAVLTGAIAQRFIAPEAEEAQTREEDLQSRLDDVGERLERIETLLSEKA
jgi:voltage-gated potassium channel